MSDKKVIDDEIGKELEDRLDDDQGLIDEDDYTVKVHREDYTVKRRFFDKGKALEEADSLRLDKGNIVEDNIEHDFVTLIDEEDDVDWDKLVDQGLEFYPPISDAAKKKLIDESRVAEELAAEKAMIGSELDKTITMGGKGKLNLPEIKPKKEREEEKKRIDDEDSRGIEVEDEIDAIEPDIQEEVYEPESVTKVEKSEAYQGEYEDESLFEESLQNKKSGSFIKISGIVIVVLVCAWLFFTFNRPADTVKKSKIVKAQAVTENQPETEPVKAEPIAVKKIERPEKVMGKKEEAVPEPSPIEETEAPVVEEILIPDVKKFHPYTIHLSSYKSRVKAASEVVRIRKRGYDAYAAYIDIPGKGGWYRIYSGYYDDYKKATAHAALIRKKLREDAIVAKTIYAVQVGSSAEKKELSGLKNDLHAKGFSAYYLPVNDTKFFRLITGAYRKKNDADKLVLKLTGKGFEAKAVRR